MLSSQDSGRQRKLDGGNLAVHHVTHTNRDVDCRRTWRVRHSPSLLRDSNSALVLLRPGLGSTSIETSRRATCIICQGSRGEAVARRWDRSPEDASVGRICPAQPSPVRTVYIAAPVTLSYVMRLIGARYLENDSLTSR
jgi:hypothetical protein